jgi:integrase
MTAAKTGRKRGNNEGSIYQRGDGRWCAAVTLPDGKRKYLYGKTRQEVSRALARALSDVQAGTPVPVGRQTVAQFLDLWLRDVVATRNRPRTYESYASLVRVHLVPGLGKHQLSQLSTQHVQTFLNDKAASGLSPRTVQYLRAVLRIALNQARKWKLVTHNVAADAEPPRQRRREVAALSRDEARRILTAFAGDAMEALVLVSLSLGLRQGEALGLRWQDIDLDAGRLRVRHQVQKHGGEWRFVEPKSKKSRRTITLPAFVVDSLRAHRTAQVEQRLSLGPLWSDHDLVFPSAVGTPQDGHNVLHRFQARLAAAGLPKMRWHDLRHGTASILLAEGVPMRVIMEILGHSQIGTTANLYAHVAPEVVRDAADRMHAALTGLPRPVGCCHGCCQTAQKRKNPSASEGILNLKPGRPGGIRTPNPLIRSQVRCPLRHGPGWRAAGPPHPVYATGRSGGGGQR